MFLKRRWRFMPDRSQLVLLGVALITLVAAVGFINLAIARSAVQAELSAIRAQVVQMEEQNSRLQDALARAQEGESIPPLALQYFGMALPGTIIVMPEEAPAPALDMQPAGPPYWAEWWKRLRVHFIFGAREVGGVE